jgi:hypothetical protein
MTGRAKSSPVLTPRRAAVSRANKVAAARVYIAASAKSGQPVPDWIRRIADSRCN